MKIGPALLITAGLILSNEIPIAAPQSSEPSSMSLRRTACYGTCPSYRITIFSDGNVVFEADDGDPPDEIATDDDFSDPVAVGRHEYKIPQAEAMALLAKFRASDFFALKDRYDNGTADAPEAELTFSDAGQIKMIWDNQGDKAGMPAALRDLQAEVDRVAVSNRLVRGKAGLVPILVAESYDFRSPQAGQMLVRAIARGADAETIKGLLDHNVSLQPDWNGKPIGQWAVHAAVTFGDMLALKLLAERGEVTRLSPAARNMIAVTAPICDVGRIRSLKAIGIDPIEAEKAGKFAVLKNATRCTSLEGGQLLKLVRYYLANGANPNAADEEGETALFGQWDTAAISLLVDHGAKLDHLNKDGQSAVFSTWDEDAMVRLMEAGVRPAGNYYGTSFWSWATGKRWSKVIAWLEAHPEMKAAAQQK